MDKKKKKIYYIVIAGCIVLSVGIIFYSSSSVPEVEAPPVVTNRPANTNRAVTDPSKKTYPVPQVFPSDTKFDDSIFESSNFKILTPATPSPLTPQDLGRENPFQAY